MLQHRFSGVIEKGLATGVKIADGHAFLARIDTGVMTSGTQYRLLFGLVGVLSVEIVQDVVHLFTAGAAVVVRANIGRIEHDLS